ALDAMPLALVDRLGEPVVLLDPVGSPGRLVELDEHGALAWDAVAWRRRRSGVGRRGSGGPPPQSRRATAPRRLLTRWRAGDCLLGATGNSRFRTTCGCRQRYGERNGDTHQRDSTRLGRCALHLEVLSNRRGRFAPPAGAETPGAIGSVGLGGATV